METCENEASRKSLRRQAQRLSYPTETVLSNKILPGSPSDLNTGNGTEGAMVCTSLGSPLFHFLCSNLKANPVVLPFKDSPLKPLRRRPRPALVLFFVLSPQVYSLQGIYPLVILHDCEKRGAILKMQTRDAMFLCSLRQGNVRHYAYAESSSLIQEKASKRKGARCLVALALRGHPYMTSALRGEGGYPQKQTK